MDYALFADLVGISYIAGGRTTAGYDCYGLVLEVGKRLGIDFPDTLYTDDYAERNVLAESYRCRFEQVAFPALGDIIAIRSGKKYITHVGVMLNHYQFMHSIAGLGVIVSRVDNLRYKQHIEGYYRWAN